MDTPSEERRRPNLTNVVFMLMIVALSLGVVLTFLVFEPAGSGPAFTVTAIDPTACPKGEGAPACFQVLVQNTGSEAANVRCELAPAAGTTAVFLTADPNGYSSAASIAPGQSIPLTVKVDVTEGNDTVISPSVICTPLGS
jgi:hypothetical protein